MTGEHESDTPNRRYGDRVSRRALLVGSVGVAAGAIGYPFLRRLFRRAEPVFIARAQRYDGPLARTIRDGLKAVGLDRKWVRDRRVILKPNLVEPTLIHNQFAILSVSQNHFFGLPSLTRPQL